MKELILHYYKRFSKYFVLQFLMLLIGSAINLYFPILTKKLIDVVIPEKNISQFISFAIIVGILYVVQVTVDCFKANLDTILVNKIEIDMMKKLFEKTQTLRFKYFDDNQTGKITSKYHMCGDVSSFVTNIFKEVVSMTVMILGSIFILFNMNITLTMVSLIPLPVFALYVYKISPKIRDGWRSARDIYSNLDAKLTESVLGIKTTRLFCNESLEKNKIRNMGELYNKETIKTSFISSLYFLGIRTITDFSKALAVIVSVILIFKGYLSVGEMVAFVMYINKFIGPIQDIGNTIRLYQRGMSSYDIITEFMNEQSEEDNNANGVKLDAGVNSVEFKDVSFSYDGATTAVNNVSFKLNKNESIAIVGKSGAGKTSIINLIPKFYDIQSGQILINDINIEQFELNSLRSNIGIVSQDIFLFDGTIEENISYGNTDASFDEIRQASIYASAHEFIMGLSDGYKTLIGEIGVKLSGGQKQRISIARMLLKNPSLLIFDEATSSLDNISEQQIRSAIETLSKERTSIIIAHRLSTIKSVQKILVLSEEGIVESGTHDELMKNKGYYYELYNSSKEEDVE